MKPGPPDTDLSPGSGKTESSAALREVYLLHEGLKKRFGSVRKGLLAMLDEIGDPYTLVRDFAIIDTSEKKEFLPTVIMHLPTGKTNEFKADWLDTADLLEALSAEDDNVVLEHLRLV